MLGRRIRSRDELEGLGIAHAVIRRHTPNYKYVTTDVYFTLGLGIAMDTTDQAKLLANALYEIRLLLSGYIGSSVDADMSVRADAHSAFALHNEALAISEGKTFDLTTARSKVKAIDGILGEQISERLL